MPRTNATPKRRKSDRRRRGAVPGVRLRSRRLRRQDRHGIDDGLGGRRRVRRGGVGRLARRRRIGDGQRGVGVARRRLCRRTSAASSGSPRASRRRVWRRWQPGRPRSWAGRSSDAHARSACAGLRPWQRATSSPVHANLSRDGRLGRRDWDAGHPQTLRGRPRQLRSRLDCGPRGESKVAPPRSDW